MNARLRALVKWRWLASLMLALAMAGVAGGVSAQESGATGLVTTVSWRDRTSLQWLAARYDVWTVDHAAHTAVVYLSDAELAALRAGGFTAEVDTAATRRLAATVAHIEAAGSDGDTIPGYACYRTVEKTFSDLTALVDAHPTLARWEDAGDSWLRSEDPLQGYNMQVLIITNQAITQTIFSDMGTPGTEKPKFFLMAAIHAREYVTAETATRFAEYLLANYGRDPDITWLIDYTEIHIMPQANPDGRKIAETGVLWRKNVRETGACGVSSTFSDGVDLNRNSSFKWDSCGDGFCSSSDGCYVTYRGSAAQSEPEVQAIEGYLRSIFPDSRGPDDLDAAPADASGLLITLHSYSNLVLYPWGWSTTESPNHAQLGRLGSKFGYFTRFQVCRGPECLYATDGTTDDFSYGELGVASYTFEIGSSDDGFFASCNTFEQTLFPDQLRALSYAAKAAPAPYRWPFGPEALFAAREITVTVGSPIIVPVTLDATRHRPVVLPSPIISDVRASLDTAPWISGTVPLTVTADGGGLNSAQEEVLVTVASAAITTGRSLLWVQGLADNGEWGAPSALFVNVVESGGEPVTHCAAPNCLWAPQINSAPPE